jgi:hypothetical protein
VGIAYSYALFGKVMQTTKKYIKRFQTASIIARVAGSKASTRSKRRDQT